MLRKLFSKQWLITVLVISGCATIGVAQYDRLYGKAEPRDRIVQTLSPAALDYWTDVKPVIDKRCIVCHGCYDAPCQLKMTSIEGIIRGANVEKVYNQSRIKQADPTRMFMDAQTVSEWRDKDFHTVLNERDNQPVANREASVMYKILQLKQENPLPDVKQLPKDFDLRLNRKQVCTNAQEFDKYAKKNPLWGMPYALPGLSNDEQKTLMSWVEQGATYTPRTPLPADYVTLVDSWEQYFNEPSLKQQLTSRYIYEHLSFAHLYFSAKNDQDMRFFALVRSLTPPGEPVAIIAGRRPFDDPAAEDRVYYRLQEYVGTIVDKTHMPYALSEKRMAFWQSLFNEPDYAVSELPSYDPESASNPFVTFNQLPINSRYKFLLDEAKFTINAFIKGPVCRGEVAVDVIDDRFWVFFVNPDNKDAQNIDKHTQTIAKKLDLPASQEVVYRISHYWKQYKQQQTEFLTERDEFIVENYGGTGDLTLDFIWDGYGTNPNAALTVFRHSDNATVEQGMLGGPTKTAWVIDYSLLERIHYLLVAGYDVYGNVGHQLNTRLYMDFLRMEGESDFLILLPDADRDKERDYWYRDADPKVLAYVSSPTMEGNIEPNIDYKTDNPKIELFNMLEQRLAPALPKAHTMAVIKDPETRQQLEQLTKLAGTSATLMPEVTFLNIRSADGDEYVTVVRNKIGRASCRERV